MIVVHESSGLVLDKAKNSPSVFFLQGLYSTSKVGSLSLEYRSSRRPMVTNKVKISMACSICTGMFHVYFRSKRLLDDSAGVFRVLLSKHAENVDNK